MQVRQRPVIARGLLTSQIWLKVGPFYHLLDDPPPDKESEGMTPFGAMLAAFAS